MDVPLIVVGLVMLTALIGIPLVALYCGSSSHIHPLDDNNSQTAVNINPSPVEEPQAQTRHPLINQYNRLLPGLSVQKP